MSNQDYYDTQPTNDYGEADVVDGVYEDPTHLPEIDKEITEGVKDSISIKLATWMRQKVYGADVRETMARFILWISVLYNRILAVSDKLSHRQNDVEKKFENLNDKFDSQLQNSTTNGEVIDARTSGISNKKYSLIGKRLDAMEQSHFTYPYGYANSESTILDNYFSKNHEVLKEGTITSDSLLPGLIIAEIDNISEDTFYLQKVGEV